MKKKILVGYLALCMAYVGAFSYSNEYSSEDVANTPTIIQPLFGLDSQS